MTSIITLCIVVITFVAISVIITKAGFSRGWALIPLTPLLTWIVTLVVAKIQLHSFVIVWELAPFYPHTIDLLLDVDKIAIFASWIFLLLFAFSHWPTRSVAAPSEQAATKTRVRGPVRGGAGTAASAVQRQSSRYPLPLSLIHIWRASRQPLRRRLPCQSRVQFAVRRVLVRASFFPSKNHQLVGAFPEGVDRTH